jgi:hypothetical protein
MSKHTLEQVLEALINKEDDRASDLLHQYFVQKGKSIYEELSQFDEAAEEELDEEVEEELEEGFGDSASHDFEDEVIANEEDLEDESLFGEAEGDEDPMAADEPTDDEATADLAMGDEAEGGEGAPADAADAAEKLDVATDALEELKAFFAELTGDAPAMGGDEPAMDDAPAMGGDEPTEEGYRAFGEATTLKAVSKPTPGDNGANTKSPTATGKRIDSNGAKAVNFTGEAGAGQATPGSKTDDMGNVNKVGNAKAPAPKSVSVPKNSDAASNKTSPVAKS